jgi:branched-chain amino acid transport system permease protein
MERPFSYLFDGLSNGSVYSLLALGLVVIYRGTGHLNFAHGEMALFCTYVFFQVHEWGIPVALALVVAVAFGFALGALTEVALVRPVAKKSEFAVFIVTIGLFSGINWLASAIWGPNSLPEGATGKQVEFPLLVPDPNGAIIKVGTADWRNKYLVVLLVVVVLSSALFALFKYTKLGLAMRAVASNAESSRLVGIKTSTVLMVSWGLAVAIGAVGGILFAGINNNVNTGLMFTVFLYASAAATLGGFDSPGGAVLAGLFLGMVESFAAGYAADWVGSEMKQAVALIIILVVLLVKPSGLFGTAKVERV